MKKFSKRKVLIIIIILAIILAFIGIAIYKSFNSNSLANNPKDTDIKKIIEKVNGAYSICLATEDNDPNGNLNKSGGYTGAVYFRLKQVDLKLKDEAIEDYGEEYVNSGEWTNYYDESKDSCTAGTDSGGQIEIYKNQSDAKKRDDYLKTFDGSVVSGGYHVVKDTLVIRISNELTASQQKEIANEIIDLLDE